MNNNYIYLDYNATTPVLPEVQKTVAELASCTWGNPSSQHRLGRAAMAELASAREKLAAWIGAQPAEMVFTSGGTEANNLVIQGAWEAVQNQNHSRTEVLALAVEHSSVLAGLKNLARRGAEVQLIPVDAHGRVDLEKIAAMMTEKTALVSAMLINNEIGNLYPVAEIGRLAHASGALLHCDAVCAVGRMPVDVKTLECDFLSFSAHKFYGPKGVGGLYVRTGSPLLPILWGGDQERQKRAGTENVPGIAGMAKALEICLKRQREFFRRTQNLSVLLRQNLANVPEVVFHGDPDPQHRVPWTINMKTAQVSAQTLLPALDLAGFAVSAGSACASGSLEPSHVLMAMGQDKKQALCSLRVSLGWETTEAEIAAFSRTLIELLRT